MSTTIEITADGVTTRPVPIDPMLEDNLEHFKSLRFGDEIELRITGIVGKNTWTIRINEDTGEEKVTHTIGVAVHSYENA